MSWVKESRLFILFSILALCVLVFSIYDIIFDKGWMLYALASFAILIILVLVLIIFRYRKGQVEINTIGEFEKSLKGGLFHFKCPTCEGIFAIKKSKSNDEKPIKMTCPDCGSIGIVPPNPTSVEEEIPEKKSIKANFKCNICGEGITVWAEGTDLYKNMHVYSCPFCGKDQTMDKI